AGRLPVGRERPALPVRRLPRRPGPAAGLPGATRLPRHTGRATGGLPRCRTAGPAGLLPAHGPAAGLPGRARTHVGRGRRGAKTGMRERPAVTRLTGRATTRGGAADGAARGRAEGRDGRGGARLVGARGVAARGLRGARPAVRAGLGHAFGRPRPLRPAGPRHARVGGRSADPGVPGTGATLWERARVTRTLGARAGGAGTLRCRAVRTDARSGRGLRARTRRARTLRAKALCACTRRARARL